MTSQAGDRRVPHAGVADHVRVREVGDDEVVGARPDGLDQGVGDAGRAHRRLEVVGRDPRARDEPPLLAGIGSLDAAVEEVRHVGVLLGLGDVELAPARLRERLGQRPGLLGREGDLDRQAGLVLGHRDDQQVSRGGPAVGRRPVEAVEDGIGQRVDQLSRPVGPEVGVDDRLAVADHAVDPVDHGRRRRTRRSRRGRRPPRSPRSAARRVLPHPVDDRVVASLDALPALVAVHRVVAAADRRDPGVGVRLGQPALEVGDEPEGRARRRVATVEQRVDADARDVRDARASSTRATRCRSLAWTPPGPMRLTTWRRPPGRVARWHASSSAGRVSKRPVGDRGIDARQVLEDRTPGPEVQVPDLRVAHLAGRQADRLLRGPERRVRPVAQERSPGRHRRGGDRVGRRVVTDPEAVEDDQDDRSRSGRRPTGIGGRSGRAGPHPAWRRAAAVRPARATMPAISSGLSEAPPTSAPSIAGSARNSPMLAEVTLPP